MSGNSADEQSEDGELRQSPQIVKNTKDEMDFSLSEDDAEVVDDSLDIKPPQAKAALPSSKSKRREGHRRSSDKHRDERYSHRDKHHREQKRSLGKDPRTSAEHYQREKDRFYREQQQTHQSNPEFPPNERRERRVERNRHPERKHDDKKSREVRDSRHVTREAQVRDMEKQYENQKFKDDRHRDKADKALHDLRERLLSKRTTKDDHSDHKSRSDGHRHRRSKPEEIALEGEAGMYVKEMITLTTSGDDKKSRRKAKEEEREKLTDEERQEQELRREKLLEAEREMARLKEQSKIDRERRHQEKTTKRKQEMDEALSKRMKMEDMVVMVSDNSDYEDLDTRNNSENSPGDNSENEDKSDTDKESVEDGQSSEDEQSARSRSDRSSESRKHSSRSRSKSKSRSRSRSKSFEERDRSRTRSEERDFETDKQKAEAKEKIQDKDKPVEDDESRKPKLDEDLPPYFPAIQGCRSVEEFQCLNRIEEGTYGVVYRARDKRTEEIVALKRLKMEKEKEGFPITSLREINTLLKGQHKNIVTVREIVVGSNMDKIFIVMDYVEHDLKSLMETMRHKKQSFTSGEVKCILRQLLLAVGHLHDNWILHRDLKTSNLLLSHKGILKVGDFGLAREYGSPLKAYTPIVVTLWYRAPELLLCTKEYSTPIDMWSVGCIFAELVLMNALFPGKSEVDQLNRIFKDLGTPSEKIWPGFNKLPAVQKMKFTEYPVSNLRNKFHALTENGVDLLLKFLTFDPVQRITAEAALEHPYFVEHPLPIDPAMFPTWPAKSELGQKRAMNTSPKPPSGGGEYKKLRGDDDGYGFRIGAGLENKRTMGFSLKF